MKSTQKLAYFILFGVVALMLAGCGATKASNGGSSSSSSRSDVLDESQGLLAECNELVDDSKDIDLGFSTYYDAHNQAFNPSLIRMKVNQLPSGVTTSATTYVQFFRFYANESGQKIIDNNPVGIHFIARSTGQTLNQSSPITVLSKNSVQTVIANNGLGDEGINLTNFFNQTVAVLNDIGLQYDGILVALYDEGNGTQAYGYAEALLPAFSADPIRYAANHPVSLQQLHPFAGLNGQYNEQGFYQLAEQMCASSL